MNRLSVSLVEYATDPAGLAQTLRSLAAAARYAEVDMTLLLVNNGTPGRLQIALAMPELQAQSLRCIEGQGNVGFGAGHNCAIAQADADMHLLLNPDVTLAEDALDQGIRFLLVHPEVGLLVPAVFDGNGEPQYLCKRYPTVLDLLLRGFAPAWLQEYCRERLDRYEMRDVIGDVVVLDPPIVSGCFMLFRTSVLKRLGGFDPRYFLYFEDFDLSLRAGRITHIAQVSNVKIVHHGGHAARKGWHHIRMFVRSGITFFNTHGW
ncbi:MAG TPA: glycosyltransferase, partial [Accumulibacter sp.]|uniref:glycosyltransferase n=1 Tax=Accumulibacter sp. TaxID=2053492 RepID=UPI002C290CD1